VGHTTHHAPRSGGGRPGPLPRERRPTVPPLAPGVPVLALLPPDPFRRPARQLVNATVAVLGVSLALGKRFRTI